MSILRDMHLPPVSVRVHEPVLAAGRLLVTEGISALAVVDEDQRVIGLFTDDDLLRGLFPHYLEELHHTAFLVDDVQALQASVKAAEVATVSRHMRDAVTVEIDAAAVHVVERFLHTPWGALAVVEEGRFVGMLGQLEFTDQLLRRLERPG